VQLSLAFQAFLYEDVWKLEVQVKPDGSDLSA